MKYLSLLYKSFGVALLLMMITSCQRVSVEYIRSFENTRHPEILYWMWNDSTLENKQYLKDIDKMAEESPFDLVFLSSRFTDDIGFYNSSRLHDPLKEMVEYAHSKGIRIGLQLWGMNKVHHLYDPDIEFTTREAESMIVDGECLLDALGEGTVVNVSRAGRQCVTFHSDMFRVYLFKKTADGFYRGGSLIEPEQQIVRVAVDQKDNNTVTVKVTAGKEYSGYTAYVQTIHYYNYPDVFSEDHTAYLKEMLDAYSDIPFDGTALDEHGAMAVRAPHQLAQGETFRERAFGESFAAYYCSVKEKELAQTLLEMRYVPQGEELTRIRAINDYFDVWRQGMLKVENDFADHSRRLFGKDCFIGVHSTYHGHFQGDDIWITGISWWELPRAYGQTDEYHPTPEKMGIGAGAPQPVMYNMFYNGDARRIYREALSTASLGVRLHYHGWNDHQDWGVDLSGSDFLKGLAPVESRIRLLNHFDPAPPATPILVVYNFPYLFNWYPDADRRGTYDVRNVPMQKLAQDIWNAGYHCAAVPSTYIDTSRLKVEEDGTVSMNGRTFEAVVVLYPQYAKKSTLEFLENVAARGGKIMFEGEATLDFDGNDCRARFNALRARALAEPFSIDNLGALEVSKNDIREGIRLEDGSVVMSDYASIETDTPTSFTVRVGKNEYTGSYTGVFALKENERGKIEKLVCGDFKSLKRNGETILELERPADIVLLRQGNRILLWITGEEATHFPIVARINE